MDYMDSGVDIKKADLFVSMIQKTVRNKDPRLVSGVGGFAAVYKISDKKLIAASTDGVGTKLLLAQEMGHHAGIGYDLVAMCVNDLLCVGAAPIFFLDYFATGKLDLDSASQILKSIQGACEESSMLLIGGETAEMPDLYKEKEYDLAGFAIGEMPPEDYLDESKVKEGDVLLGLGSSGFHSNGFSLLRKIPDLSAEEKLQLLSPTKIYVKSILALKEKFPQEVHGMSHITGSGFWNIPRMAENKDYQIHFLPPIWETPEILSICAKRSGLSQEELYSTFNMGIGMVLAVSSAKAQAMEDFLKAQGERVWRLGSVAKGTGKVQFRTPNMQMEFK